MFSTACLVPHLCCSPLSLLWGATATAASWAGWLAPLVSEGAIIWFCSPVLLFSCSLGLLVSWSLGLLLLGLGESQRRPLCSHQLEQCDGKGIPTARHFDRVQWLFAKHPHSTPSTPQPAAALAYNPMRAGRKMEIPLQ
jgi:hypothetical protein